MQLNYYCFRSVACNAVIKAFLMNVFKRLSIFWRLDNQVICQDFPFLSVTILEIIK